MSPQYNNDPELLKALKGAHKAADILMAMLIQADPTFLPTKSPVWPLIVQTHEAIQKAEMA